MPPAYDGPNWLTKLDMIRKAFQENLEEYKRHLDMYNSDYYKKLAGSSEVNIKQAEYNFLYMMTDNMQRQLVPVNPRFTVSAVEHKTQWSIPNIERVAAEIAERCGIRDELNQSVMDGVLAGRWAFKVVRDIDGAVDIRTVDMRRFFFDTSVRRVKDIAWCVECVELHRDIVWKRSRGRKSLYRLPSNIGDASKLPVNNDDKVCVWEVYDQQRKEMTCWIEGYNKPIAVYDKQDYWWPYTIGWFSSTGTDTKGLAHAKLVAPFVCEMNMVLSVTYTTVQRQIPVTLYDSDRLSPATVSAIANAQPGAFIPRKMVEGSSEIGGNLFEEAPVPRVPVDWPGMMAELERLARNTSAMAAVSRGQVSGARTASEIAIIESNSNTIVTGLRSVWQVTVVGAMAMALALDGSIEPSQIAEAAARLTMVLDSASQMNRTVLQEQFMQVYTLASKIPGFDMDLMNKQLVSLFGLPEDAYKGAGMAQVPPTAPEQTDLPPPQVPDVAV